MINLKNENAMIEFKLYKTDPNKMTEFVCLHSTETIPIAETTVTINATTYVFKHVITDNYNIAIVEEQKSQRRNRTWNKNYSV